MGPRNAAPFSIETKIRRCAKAMHDYLAKFPARLQNESKNASLEGRQMRKKIFSKHLLSYVFDGALSLGLVILSILEWPVLRKVIGVEIYGNLPMGSYAVTITLIPCVVTIVSAVLGLSKEKIYGVTIAEIGELRDSFYFVHLHKMLVVCVLLGMHSLLFGFGLKICLYYLEIASFAYAVIFSVQEISVFVHSRRELKSIFRKRYLYDAENNYLFRKTASKTFKTMSQNLVVTEGIEIAYDNFKDDNNDYALIEYLMAMQNQYLIAFQKCRWQ